MTRSLPVAQIAAPNAVIVPVGGVAAPAFDAAVAAHVFEPELALGASATARRHVRYSAGMRRWRAVAVNLWLGVAASLVWYISVDARDGLNNVSYLDLVWFCVAVLVFAAFGLGAFENALYDQVGWLRDGAPVAAYVAELRVDDKGDVLRYVVRLRYWRGPARLTEDDLTVTKTVYDHLLPGATLTLICHPDRNDLVRPYYQFTMVEAA